MGLFYTEMENEDVNCQSLVQPVINNCGDDENLEDQLVKLQLEVLTLQKEKDDIENDFGLKRARLKDLFLQKEEIAKQNADSLQKVTAERDELVCKLKLTKDELDEVRNVVAALQCTSEIDLDKMRKEHQEELDNLHHLLSDLHQEEIMRYKSDLDLLKKKFNVAEMELSDLKSDKENILSEGVRTISNVTKNFAKRVENLSNVGNLRGTDTSNQNVKKSNKYAQEDADFVKSLIPFSLDEEVKVLKDKLREAYEKIRIYESCGATFIQHDNVNALLKEKASCEVVKDLDDKLKELSCGLEAEKSSRADLEAYVSILNTQKLLLQEETDRLRSQLKDSETALHLEKRAHNELKNTWQMANDKFLESQHHHELEIQKLHDLLNGDRAKINSGETEDFNYSTNEGFMEKIKPKYSSSLLSQLSPIKKKRSTSHSKPNEKYKNKFTDDQVAVPNDSELVINEDKTDGNIELPNATGIPENSCSNCLKFKSELENVITDRNEISKNTTVLERNLERLKTDIEYANKERKELTQKWAEIAKESEKQILELHEAVKKSEFSLKDIQNTYFHWSQDISAHVHSLEESRKFADTELKRLQEENEILLGNHVKTSNELREEIINLPNNIEDLHLYVLKLQDNLIAAKVGQETFKNKAKSFDLQLQEVMAVKESYQSRMQEFHDMSEASKSYASREQARRLEMEKEIMDLNETIGELRDKIKQQEISYQKLMDENSRNQSNYEEDILELKNKISTLQKDLDNSEVVQRDFVKLSQSLQVQLENIRQSEQEVRWQHEEDISECLMCKIVFSSMKEKQHCRHCGKIFCLDCLSKTVISGPNGRVSRVCEVCHTILVKDIAPYFSMDAPNVPG